MRATGIECVKSLQPFEPNSGHLHVIIETPKGHRAKYSFNEKNGVFLLKSLLPAGMLFPFDFGFIPGKIADDGDPLDILALVDEPATQGCLMVTRLLAVIEAEQTEKGRTNRNDRLIGIAVASRRYKSIDSLEQLSPDLLEEIEDFFASYNELMGRKFQPIGRAGADRARKLVEAACRNK